MGDAAGIGPEIILKSLNILKKDSHRFILIGCFKTFIKTLEKLSFSLNLQEITTTKDLALNTPGAVMVYNPTKLDLSSTTLGELSDLSSKASMMFIEEAVKLCQKNITSAIVTAPITKEGIQRAGFNFNGHTDFLAHLTNTERYSMMFAYQDIKILLATIHEPLNKVSSLLNIDLVYDKIIQAQKAAEMFGIKNPKIAIAGFNPHAGENALFGHEEKDIIIPAVNKALNEKINIEGPIAPDTLFYRGITLKEFDIIVTLYHDQGLIPFKMIAFDKGVNITVGLPFLRTSPDHGTAYNIAGKMIANPDSMTNAIKMAEQLK